jgi:hypothetical protein
MWQAGSFGSLTNRVKSQSRPEPVTLGCRRKTTQCTPQRKERSFVDRVANGNFDPKRKFPSRRMDRPLRPEARVPSWTRYARSAPESCHTRYGPDAP